MAEPESPLFMSDDDDEGTVLVKGVSINETVSENNVSVMGQEYRRHDNLTCIA